MACAAAVIGDIPRRVSKNCQEYKIQIPKLDQPKATPPSTNATLGEKAVKGTRGVLTFRSTKKKARIKMMPIISNM